MKIYDSDDVLEEEGEYLNGLQHGKGKDYFNGQLEFEGNYLNGHRNGFGRKYENGHLVFEGDYYNGYKFGTLDINGPIVHHGVNN